MENNITAVEWLYQQFENGDMYNVEDAQRILHVALKMEAEQWKYMHKLGYEEGLATCITLTRG